MSSENQSDKVIVKQSRDSKWLLPAISIKTEGHVTRKVARKFAPKVMLRVTKQKKTKVTKSKANSSSQSHTVNSRKKKQKNRKENPTETVGTKKKGAKTVTKGKQCDEIQTNDKNGSKGKRKLPDGNKTGGVKKTNKQQSTGKKKITAKIVVEENNVIHIKTESANEGSGNDDTDIEKLGIEDSKQNTPIKRCRNSARKKTKSKRKSSSAENDGFPSIEDELKLIEGESLDRASLPKKRKTRKRTKPLPSPTRHCNLCPESFYSELDLAQHCRQVHFKHKFIFKDEGIEELLGTKEKIFKRPEKSFDEEHHYAKDNIEMKEVKSAKMTETIETESGKLKSENTSQPVVAAESVVVVRKVTDKDKKFCKFCQKMFLSDKGLKDHIEMRCTYVPFRCYCGKGLREENEPHTHYPNFKIPKYKSSKSRIECDNCKKKFSFQETFQNHTFSCTARDKAQTIEKENKNMAQRNIDYECSTCKQVFQTERALKKHQYSHRSDPDAAECDVCGKLFASKSGLRTHKEIHTERKRFICEHCGAGFFQKGNLMTHLKSSVGLCRGMKGVNTLMVECNICQRSFTSLNRLRQHERKHERVEELMSPDGLSCTECGKCFKAIHEYKRHRMTHTGERPYVCCFCKKAFAQKSNMMAHIRIHTGYRPYECYICGQGFTQGTTLKVHVEKNHDINTYKFKKLPRGRRFRDTSSEQQVSDIEQEYIDKALKDNSFHQHYESKRNKSGMKRIRTSSKLKGTGTSGKKEMGTQADDGEYLYYDEEEDEEGNAVELYIDKEKVTNTDSVNQVKDQLQIKEISKEKIYFQVVSDELDAETNKHVTVDTKTLEEVIKRSLYHPKATPAIDTVVQRSIPEHSREVSVSSSGANKKTICLPSRQATVSAGQVMNKSGYQPARVVTTDDDAMRRLSEEAVKRALYESARGDSSEEIIRKFLSHDSISKVVDTTVPQPTETQKQLYTFNIWQRKNLSSQVSTNTSGKTEQAKSYTVIQKGEHMDKVHDQVPQLVSKTLGSREAIAQPDVKAKVSYFQRVVTSSGEHLIAINPSSCGDNSSFVSTNIETESFSAAQPKLKFETINKQDSGAAAETCEAVKYNPVTESETKTAIDELQKDQNILQRKLQSNENIVQTYRVMGNVTDVNQAGDGENLVIGTQSRVATYNVAEETENNVEYVTVIFEDDGTDTVEQEIGLSQTGVVSEVQSVHVTNAVSNSGSEFTYVSNVSEMEPVSEVMTEVRSVNDEIIPEAESINVIYMNQ